MDIFQSYTLNVKITQFKTRRDGASVHFGVVVVELINYRKCGGIVRNQIW